VVIFFSLSKSKLPGYILTATVACGILTARFFERAMANPEGKAARIIRHAAIAMAALSAVAAIAAIILAPHMGSLAKPMGVSAAAATELGRHFVPTIILFACAALGLLPHFHRNAGICFFAFAIFPVLLFMLNFGIIKTTFDAKSTRQLSQKIPALTPETRLVFVQCFPCGLPFYLERTAVLITRDGDELKSASNYISFRLSNDPAWPANLVPLTNFDQWISQRKSPVYLIIAWNNRAELDEIGVRPADIQTLNRTYLGVLLAAP
jgi:hypothetical protein